jgi:D-alanyl-D-alanine carboxypeptidase/D-alanyl-D-alanine-endopeptidase (penicillin-binding protein 4)
LTQSDRRHSHRERDERGWVGRALASLLVLALVAAGVAAWRLDLVEPWYDHFTADSGTPPAGPADVPPPPGLELAPVAAPPAVDTALTPPGALDPALVQQALAPLLADESLGRHVVAAVSDLTAAADARPLVSVGDGPATPASTTKLLTSTAALAALGPETRFTTRVVSAGPGRIVLVGGGDPYLASTPPSGSTYPERADVVTLAQQTAAALQQQGRTKVRLGYDDTMFSDPTFNPAWPAHYLPEDVVSPITALWVDEGRVAPGSPIRSDDPALAAAQAYADALTAQGIRVVGTPTRGRASAGTDLASVQSAPLREIVQHVLEVSDNEAAEVLSHQVGFAVSGTASFEAGAAGVLSTLQGLGVPLEGVRLYDGSGLSRQNLITPAALVGVLRAAVDPSRPQLDAVAQGLPVAGFSGSLTNRFDLAYPQSRGLVRAKTGTLSNISSLAGIAVDQQGHLMLFALMADRIADVDETKAQHALDAAAGALAACSCGAAPAAPN